MSLSMYFDVCQNLCKAAAGSSSLLSTVGMNLFSIISYDAVKGVILCADLTSLSQISLRASGSDLDEIIRMEM